jgi:hypothetical protein
MRAGLKVKGRSLMNAARDGQELLEPLRHCIVGDVKSAVSLAGFAIDIGCDRPAEPPPVDRWKLVACLAA